MIQVGELPFKSQKALGEYVRAIRDKYPDGATVQPPDDRFLYHFIKRHPDYPEKFGHVSRFIVDSDGRNSRCFYAIDTAGRRIDFSFRICISGNRPTAEQEARQAARDTIISQVLAFRDQALGPGAACANGACLVPLTLENVHVDHRPPWTFARLWEIFRQQHPDLDLAASETDGRGGVRRFRNQRTALEWSYFHGRHARLRLLCRDCNTRREC